MKRTLSIHTGDINSAYGQNALQWAIHLRTLYGIETLAKGLADYQLIIGNPYHHGPVNKKSSALALTWEANDLPPELIESVKTHRAAIVFNDANYKQLANHLPTFKVPQGTDVSFSLPTKRTAFRFGTIGAVYPTVPNRKRILELCQAFSKAFPVEDTVEFHVKLTPSCPKVPCYDSRIVFNHEHLQRSEIAEFVQGCDCGVFLGAMESWGHGQLEFMAAGRSVITPYHFGLPEYAARAPIYLISTTSVEPDGEYYNGASSVLHGNVDDLIAKMREVFYNPIPAYTKGFACAQLTQGFTWAASTSKLRTALKTIFPDI
jgi:glycosyltransferase involved in cell wall biosynthesis